MDVLEKITIYPPGLGIATTIPVAISITKVFVTPPPPSRTIEFDGVVEFIPPSPASVNGKPIGHWKISGRDVLVSGLTEVDKGIAVGSAVHVKGVMLPVAVLAPSATSQQILATEITKR